MNMMKKLLIIICLLITGCYPDTLEERREKAIHGCEEIMKNNYENDASCVSCEYLDDYLDKYSASDMRDGDIFLVVFNDADTRCASLNSIDLGHSLIVYWIHLNQDADGIVISNKSTGASRKIYFDGNQKYMLSKGFSNEIDRVLPLPLTLEDRIFIRDNLFNKDNSCIQMIMGEMFSRPYPFPKFLGFPKKGKGFARGTTISNQDTGQP